MTTHQSRPPFKPEFQAAVTNARSDGTERALGANSDEAALPVGKVPPRGSSRAVSSEGIAIGGKTSPGMERSARWSKCKSPGKTEASTNMAPMTSLPSRDQSRGPHSQKRKLLTTKGRSRTLNKTRIPTGSQGPHMGQGDSDEAGKSVHSAQVESSTSARGGHGDAPWECTSGSLPVTGEDDKKTRYSVGTCARQATEERTAIGKEAASAQAVKRGHQVTMIEVPDDEDDTSF